MYFLVPKKQVSKMESFSLVFFGGYFKTEKIDIWNLILAFQTSLEKTRKIHPKG